MTATRNSRSDIQVLRALAVMMVVLFHLFPNHFTGGFAGVDVFFVISGFLITGSLLRELQNTASLALAKFWAKRIRRLLPAALTVIAITVGVMTIFVPPFTRSEFAVEGVASIFYFENWSLALGATDYFADSNASPFQHFWSLAVEEQFYLIWPILLLVVVSVSKSRSKLALTAFIAVAALASFIAAVLLTQADLGSAYFNSFLRVWQFAIGAAIAHLLSKKSLTVKAAPILSQVGFAVVISSAFVFQADSGFPGVNALIPVFGAALVIIAGLAALPIKLEKIYSIKPIQFIGDISYSLYLWHWPVIVLAPFVLNRATTSFEKLLLLLISIILAWLTKTLIEDPVRNAKLLLHNKPSRTILPSLATSVILGIGVLSFSTAAPTISSTNLISLDQAKHDAADPGSKCMTKAEATEVILCNFGNQDSAYRVLLVGDSHAATHLAGFKALANEHNWALKLAYKAGCSFSLVQRNLTARGTSCLTWNQNLQTKLAAEKPFDLVVTANYSNNFLADVKAENWVNLAVEGYRAAWQPLISRGAKLVALRDNPQMSQSMKKCWDEAVTDASQCSDTKAHMLYPDVSQVAAANFIRAFAIDLTDLYCEAEICGAQRNGTYIYRNADHLSATYSKVISGELYNRLQNLLGRG